ncbi:hypothetical protein [Gallaecimonas sp. GXIMD1310]|uniref:hypothetical protein n=1 Tax=Gallaecimonas sp. GXIMD1310 TaxID=3131926 RepID=UPI0032498347
MSSAGFWLTSIAALPLFLATVPVAAADAPPSAEVIITRTVESRVAYRQGKPSPDKVAISTFPAATFASATRQLSGLSEMSDNDFQALSSGNGLNGVNVALPILPQNQLFTRPTGLSGMSGMSGAQGKQIAGSVTRATNQLAEQLSQLGGGNP